MKIAFTSDIHYDITSANRELVPFLIKHLNLLNPDFFVIAGDLANNISELKKAFIEFQRLNTQIIYIPGNHDIWIESKNKVRKGQDSFYKYNEEIPNLCQNYNILFPVKKPLIIKDTAILGSIGWYDYSLKDIRLNEIYTQNDYDKGEFHQASWNDARYAVWLKNPNAANWKDRKATYKNQEVFNIFYNLFTESFKDIPTTVKNIIIALHTNPFKECIIRKEPPSPFDAYEGSDKYGEFLINNSKCKKIHVICGHRHKKLHLMKGNVEVHRSPVGYLDYEIESFESLAKESIGFIKI